MYQGNDRGSIVGGLASGVPGEVLGLETLHQKYGVSSRTLLSVTLLTLNSRYYRGVQ
jgi:gamma-glutamyltranspeptidase